MFERRGRAGSPEKLCNVNRFVSFAGWREAIHQRITLSAQLLGG